MHRPHPLARGPGARARTFLLVALTIFCLAPAIAQRLPDTTKLQRIFGVGDDEFFKGAWMKIRPGDTGVSMKSKFESMFRDSTRQLWVVANKLGINILRVQVEALDLHMTDELLKRRTERDFCYRA